jgi:hypothetical protein
VTDGLGFILTKGGERGLETVQRDRGWAIKDGEASFPASEFRAIVAYDPKLRLNRFEAADSTVMIQLRLDSQSRSSSFLSRLSELDDRQAPQLIDSAGRAYPAVGFIGSSRTTCKVRYTRATPLEKLSEAPAATNSADRGLTLLFNVASGAEIKEFRLGAATVETYSPPLKAVQGRN